MEVECVEEDLVHCVYSSSATIDFSKDDIVNLLLKARLNNSGLNVTGMLLYDNGSFFQILEGPSSSVESLLSVIEADDRHDRVVKIIYEDIESRDFSEWTMGHSKITRDNLSKIEGLNNFFKSDSEFTDLDEGRAKKLLKAFKDGQWRSSIS